MIHPYGIILGVLVVVVLGWDFLATRNKGSRYFWLEVAALGATLPFLLEPELAQRVANWVKVGRGVDVLMYPLLLWLLRESIVSRHKRWQDNERLTALVRTMAVADRTQIPSDTALPPRREADRDPR